MCSRHDVSREEEKRKSEAQMAAAPPQSFAFSCQQKSEAVTVSINPS